MPAGLKNLGNTCYVNSFLQIWFHNVPFRQALYDWDPEEDEAERENDTLLMAERYVLQIMVVEAKLTKLTNLVLVAEVTTYNGTIANLLLGTNLWAPWPPCKRSSP